MLLGRNQVLYLNRTLGQGDKSGRCHWLWIRFGSHGAHSVPVISLCTLGSISCKHTCYRLPPCTRVHALLIPRYKNVMLIYDSHSLLYCLPMSTSTAGIFQGQAGNQHVSSQMLTLETVPKGNSPESPLAGTSVKQENSQRPRKY